MISNLRIESLPHNFQGSSNLPDQGNASQWFSDSTVSSQQQLNRGNMIQPSYEIDDLMTVPIELDWVSRLLLSQNAPEGDVTAIYGADFEFSALLGIMGQSCP